MSLARDLAEALGEPASDPEILILRLARKILESEGFQTDDIETLIRDFEVRTGVDPQPFDPEAP